MTGKSGGLALLIASVLVSFFSGSVKALETSANVALVSDYLFRGVSQTDEKGAVQGGFDFSTEHGFYAGIWASSVNFGTETSTEMDYIFGYAWESGAYSFDTSVIYFDYEGDSEFDYQEFAFSVARDHWTVGLNFSPKYLGDTGEKFYYPYVQYSRRISENLSLDVHLGYSDMEQPDIFEPGEDNYIDYSIGVSWSAQGIDMSAAWVDTTIDGLDAADGRVVFSFSKEL